MRSFGGRTTAKRPFVQSLVASPLRLSLAGRKTASHPVDQFVVATRVERDGLTDERTGPSFLIAIKRAGKLLQTGRYVGVPWDDLHLAKKTAEKTNYVVIPQLGALTSVRKLLISLVLRRKASLCLT